jgi:hypothetical protein
MNAKEPADAEVIDLLVTTEQNDENATCVTFAPQRCKLGNGGSPMTISYDVAPILMVLGSTGSL